MSVSRSDLAEVFDILFTSEVLGSFQDASALAHLHVIYVACLQCLLLPKSICVMDMQSGPWYQ